MGGPAEPSTPTGMPMNIPGENKVSVWCPPSYPADLPPNIATQLEISHILASCPADGRCLVLWNSRVYTTNLSPSSRKPLWSVLPSPTPRSLSSYSWENVSPAHPFLHQVLSLGIASTLLRAPLGQEQALIFTVTLPSYNGEEHRLTQQEGRRSFFLSFRKCLLGLMENTAEGNAAVDDGKSYSSWK